LFNFDSNCAHVVADRDASGVADARAASIAPQIDLL
jgi:hypothetical protein